MMPRITPRLDRQRALGFGRYTAGWSTPVGALASDVCVSWPAAVIPAALVERDRVDAEQFGTTANRGMAKGAEYTPSQQSRWKIGAGTEGDDRSS